MISSKRTLAVILLTSVPAQVFAVTHKSSKKGPEHESYLHYVFGRAGGYAKAAAGAGFSQLTLTPYEWGGGIKGYGRRFGSALGKHTLSSSIHYSVAHWTHEEIHYQPSGKHGFKPRLEYALLSTVITRKTTTGKRTVATGEIAGAFGSGLLSRLWQPASTRTLSAGFGSAGTSLASDAGYHVLREFWPEIRHPRRHHDGLGRDVVARNHRVGK